MASPPSPDHKIAPSSLSKSSTVPDSPSPATSAQESPIPSASQATAAAGGVVAGAAAAVGLTGLASTVAEKTGAEKPSSTTTRDVTSSSSSAGDKLAESLRAELQAAKAEIVKLKEQLQSSETTAAGLRSRGVGAGEKAGNEIAGSAQALEHKVKGADGVPVQVVLGIAVGVFVLTW